jgi:hypothetical protein
MHCYNVSILAPVDHSNKITIDLGNIYYLHTLELTIHKLGWQIFYQMYIQFECKYMTYCYQYYKVKYKTTQRDIPVFTFHPTTR